MFSNAEVTTASEEIAHQRGRRYSLVPVNEKTVKSHPYFAMSTWPRIEELVKTVLKQKGYDDSIVLATTLEIEGKKDSLEGGKPVVSIRTIPEKQHKDAGDLVDYIKAKFIDEKFEKPLDLHFESTKRSNRPTLAIDTNGAQKKAEASFSGQPTRSLSSAASMPAITLSNAKTASAASSIAHGSAHSTHNSSTPSGTTGNKKSVKHLTCFYWRTNGKCSKSDDECFYSHYDTGKYADQPRPLIPGAPAVAGKNAEKIEAIVDAYRRAHTGFYPASASELVLMNQTSPVAQMLYTPHGQFVMPVNVTHNIHHNTYHQNHTQNLSTDQSIYQNLLRANAQAPLIPASLEPQVPNIMGNRAISNPGSNRTPLHDDPCSAQSTPVRRLTVGAGRPVPSTPSSTNSAPKSLARSSFDFGNAGLAPASIGVPTPSTTSFGPQSAPLSGSFGGNNAYTTPLSTPGGVYPVNLNNGYVTACRELCVALDTQVQYLQQLNNLLVTLAYKYPSMNGNLAPVFDNIQKSLQVGVDRRALAQVYVRDDPMFGYVFGNGQGAGNMAAPAQNDYH